MAIAVIGDLGHTGAAHTVQHTPNTSNTTDVNIDSNNIHSTTFL